MRNPFVRQPEQAFLSPLVRQRRFPSVAAPVVLTVCGGVALVVAFGGTLFGLQSRGSQPMAVEVEIGDEPAAFAPQAPAIASAPADEEEPALVTALPQAAPAGDGDAMLEPILAPAEDGIETALSDASADGDLPDSGPTAAIPPALPAEISALAPEPRPAPPAVQAATQAAGNGAAGRNGAGLRPAVVNHAVNMRAAPNKGGEVLMVVPGGAAIDAATDCSWCEIRYQGRAGFIYKSFVDYR